MLKTNYTFFFSIEFIFCVGGLAGGMVVITATLSPVLGMITSSYVVSRASVYPAPPSIRSPSACL